MNETIKKIELQTAVESFEVDGCNDAPRAARNYVAVAAEIAAKYYPDAEIETEIVQHAINSRSRFYIEDGSRAMDEDVLAEEIFNRIDLGDMRIWDGTQ